jgi:hypothetical protein
MTALTHDHYQMTTRLTEDGAVVREGDETVDAAYVRRYVDARSFFEGIGGTEVHTRTPDGGIHVTATSPDGVTVRETTFTPLTTHSAP